VTSKADIIAAIEAGNARVAAVFGALSAEQLATRVYPGGRGWTARDILAHLAGRGPGHEIVLELARDPTTFDFANFDADAWNQQRVDELAGLGRDELLAEFRAVHEALRDRVAAMSDAELSVELAFPFGSLGLGDVLQLSGGEHSEQHADDVARALDLPAR
jgi:hypothetical protein